jgi:CHAT domain-containing protein
VDSVIKESTDLLLPPAIRSHLTGVSHLFIIPEFNIGQYPFHLLKPFNNNNYLVDKISYSFVPHLCNLGIFAQRYNYKLGKDNSLEVRNPLVVGNPAFSKNSGYRLISLPGAESEAKTVADSLGTTALTGEKATVDTIATLARQSDLLYFATHGYFNFENIMEGTFLAFAPDKNNPTGLWTSRQIQNAELKKNEDGNPKMAILSACQTGYGKVVPGGFIGLARAFYKAGVDFTVMSLWSVDDNKTKEFMLLYLEELKKTAYFYPASPLKRAINRFKKDNPNPVYWAAFSVFGFTF